jgi:hypothetical protein
MNRLFLSVAAFIVVSCEPGDGSGSVGDTGAAITSGRGGWESAVRDRIEAERFRVSLGRRDGDAGPLVARFDNPGLHANGEIAAEGLRLTRGDDEVQVRFRGWGRGGIRSAEGAGLDFGNCLRTGEVDAKGECLREVVRDHGDVVEAWANRGHGVHHAWRVRRAPSGPGPLRLQLDVSGGSPSLTDATTVDISTDGAGYTYYALAAWDADGRELPARFEVSGARVSVVIDDTDATYPVLIDPVLTTASTTWTPASATPTFGASIAHGCDVNGDGFDDAIVGAPGVTVTHANAGSVYVYLGSASGLTTTLFATVTDPTPALNEMFGSRVACIGRFDSGAHEDFAVAGAPGLGTVHYVLGAATVTPTPLAAVPLAPVTPTDIVSTAATANFGAAIAGVGDVDADGFDDLVVGAPQDDTAKGSIVLFAGGTTGLTAADGRAAGAVAAARLGASITSLGSLDAAPGTEWAVGAPGDPAGGAVHAFRSGTGRVPTSLGAAITGDTVGPADDIKHVSFGTSLAAGDVDGDGDPDLVVGDPGYVDTSIVGAIVVIPAASEALVESSAVRRTSGVANFGQAVSVLPARRLKGVGYLGEVAVGATDHVYTFEGVASSSLIGATAAVDISVTGIGSQISAAGDLNADGFLDLVATVSGTVRGYPRQLDNDGDGSFAGVLSTSDCDDAASTIKPGLGNDTTVNGVDTDCDRLIACYPDSDSDTFSATTATDAASDADDHWSIDGGTPADGATAPSVTGSVSAAVDLSGSITRTLVLTVAGRSPVTYTIGLVGAATPMSDVAAAFNAVELARAGGVSGNRLVNFSASGGPLVITALSDFGAGSSLVVTASGGLNTILGFTGGGMTGTGAAGSADAASECAVTGFTATAGTDCNDAVAAINTSATDDAGDGVDENCSGKLNCYVDKDQDGVVGNEGTSGATVADIGTIASACTETNVNWTGTDSSVDLKTTAPTSLDCDDLTASTYPGAPDATVDGVDRDCDGNVACYVDGDLDGYAGATIDDVVTQAVLVVDAQECRVAGHWDSNQGDCLDSSDSTSPGETDFPGDTLDQNCSGALACYADVDQDGYAANGAAISDTVGTAAAGVSTGVTTCATASDAFAAVTGDCDDSLTGASINPGASEAGGNTVDENCNGYTGCYTDADNDDYGTAVVDDARLVTASGATCAATAFAAPVPTDCNDTLSGANPGASEVVGDLIDQNCNGKLACWFDGDLDGYALSTAAVHDDVGTVTGATTVGATTCATAGDNRAALATDCDDASATIFPGSTATGPGDTVDQDCDGFLDCYVDADQDGYGSTSVVDTLAVSTGQTCGQVAGYSTFSNDCRPTDSSSYPDAPETLVDGISHDCDASINCYVDGDNDGAPSSLIAEIGVDVPGTDLTSECSGTVVYLGNTVRRFGTWSAGTNDCNDSNLGINPSKVTGFSVDAVDEDCNGFLECYADADLDGYGALSATINNTTLTVASGLSCAQTTGLGVSSVATDCADNAIGVNPGATEVAGNAVDENCNSRIGCFVDGDNDGFGISSGTVNDTTATAATGGSSCENLANLDDDNLDCNDASFAIKPGVTDVVGNGVDENCNGFLRCYVDADDDSFGLASSISDAGVASTLGDCDAGPGFAEISGDCDDSVSTGIAVNPAATEAFGNAVDEDCDSLLGCYQDNDNDGWGTVTVENLSTSGGATCVSSTTHAIRGGDCHDSTAPGASDASANPGATETTGNRLDDNCDGILSCFTDSDGDSYGTSVPVTVATASLTADGNGRYTCASPASNRSDVSGDCHDDTTSARPGLTEVTGNDLDDDCNGTLACFTDGDADGYGRGASANVGDIANVSTSVETPDPRTGRFTCVDPTDNRAAVAGDCHDDAAAAYPGATEIPGDDLDNDCNSIVACYRDSDGDTYGTSVVDTYNNATSRPYNAAVRWTCASGANRASRAGDCHDDTAAANPGVAAEVVGNTFDDDCNGVAQCYRDDDRDGFGTASLVAASTHPSTAGWFICLSVNGRSPQLSTSNPTFDCDDQDAGLSPGLTETAGNLIDENCSGAIDCYVDADTDGFGTAAGTKVSRAVTSNNRGVCTSGSSTTNNDCHDNRASANPGQPEVVGNNFDDDCSGAAQCYRDADRDGYGTTEVINDGGDLQCTAANQEAPIGGNTATETDCHDDEPLANKGVTTETVGNKFDDDCNGVALCYQNLDRDNYGVATTVADRSPRSAATGWYACDAAEQEAQISGDCHDDEPNAHPLGTEVVGNAFDDDCSGRARCYRDTDHDGYGDSHESYDGVARASVIDDDGTTTSAGRYTCDPAQGEATVAGDCHDDQASANPGVSDEVVGNNFDDDCDGRVECYQDSDRDTVGSSRVIADDGEIDAKFQYGCDTSVLESATTGDCHDDNPAARPDPAISEIVGNRYDDNCDGEVSCFENTDRDGYGSAVVVTYTAANEPADVITGLFTCNASNQRSNRAGDCHDDDATANPNGVEVVGNDLDDDCSASATCYVDRDGDGWGTATTAESTARVSVRGRYICASPPDKVAGRTGDCHDDEPTANPDGVEFVGNGFDDDCSGRAQCWQNLDRDGFGTRIVADDDGYVISRWTDEFGVEVTDDAGHFVCSPAPLPDPDPDDAVPPVTPAEAAIGGNAGETPDCHDDNADAYPGANELIGDIWDNDCVGGASCFEDLDRDGFGTAEVPDDGFVRSPSVIGDDGHYECASSAFEATVGRTPNFETVVGYDCHDTNKDAHPGLVEIVGNPYDDDCVDGAECFADADGDDFGRVDGVVSVVVPDDGAPHPTEQGTANDDGVYFCSPEVNEASREGDCHDDAAVAYPGAVEIPGNEFDDDCNGRAVCYSDDDGDGWGDNEKSDDGLRDDAGHYDCDAPEFKEAVKAGDCNDARPDVNPGLSEEPGDGLDNDCNGVAICYEDLDQDGFGTDPVDVNQSNAAGIIACEVALNQAAEPGDCHDNNDEAYPGFPGGEILGDDWDNDCDGYAWCFFDGDSDTWGTEPYPDDGTRVTLDDGSFSYKCDPAAFEASRGFALPDPAGRWFVAEDDTEFKLWDCHDDYAGANPSRTEDDDAVVGNAWDEDCKDGAKCFQDLDADGWGTEAVADDGALFTATSLPNLGYPVGAVIPPAPVASLDPYFPAIPERGQGVRYQCTTDARESNLGGQRGESDFDCHDNNAAAHPGVAVDIIGNGWDDDCSGRERCYYDGDQDGYGVTRWAGRRQTLMTQPVVLDDGTITVPSGLLDRGGQYSCDASAFESSVPGDCHDDVPAAHPGVIEIAGNEEDDDCDGVALCYRDFDADGFGAAEIEDDYAIERASSARPPDAEFFQSHGTAEGYLDAGHFRCRSSANEATVGDAVRDGVYNMKDCNDLKANVHPGYDHPLYGFYPPGVEHPGDAPSTIGNADDENCDGIVQCWRDGDADGYGDARAAQADRFVNWQPDGSGVIDDSADGQASLDSGVQDTGAPEVAELILTVPSTNTTCTDPGEADDIEDCEDDFEPSSPEGREMPGNSHDEDCDGEVWCWADADGDGWGRGSAALVNEADIYVDTTGKCGDEPGEAESHPGALGPLSLEEIEERFGYEPNGCETSEGAALIQCKQAAYAPGAVPVLAFRLDPCDDGDIDDDLACLAKHFPDCNDDAVEVNPEAAETLGDLIDQDCNTRETCFADGDADNYIAWDAYEELPGGVPRESPSMLCEGAKGLRDLSAADRRDCNDQVFAIRPFANDIPYDGVDSDCQQDSDFDADGDGWDDRTKSAELIASNVRPICPDTPPALDPDAPEGTDAGPSLAQVLSTIYPNCTSSDCIPGDAEWKASLLLAFGVDPVIGCGNGGDCNDTTAATNPLQFEECEAQTQVDDDCDGNVNTARICWDSTFEDSWSEKDVTVTRTVRVCDGGTHNFEVRPTQPTELAAFEASIAARQAIEADASRGPLSGPVWLDKDADNEGDSGKFVNGEPNPRGAVAVRLCSQAADPLRDRWVTNFTDCDDANGQISSFGKETCDRVDNDCNGVVDNPQDGERPADCVMHYLDDDGDNFGRSTEDPGDWLCICPGYNEDENEDYNANQPVGGQQPLRNPACGYFAREDELNENSPFVYTQGFVFDSSCYVKDSSDCSDINADIRPNGPEDIARETINGGDDDCDGRVALVELDCDLDGAFARPPLVPSGFEDGRDLTVQKAEDLGLQSCVGLIPPRPECFGKTMPLLCDARTGLWEVELTYLSANVEGSTLGNTIAPRPPSACDGWDCDDQCPRRCEGLEEACDGLDNNCVEAYERLPDADDDKIPDDFDGVPDTMDIDRVKPGFVDAAELDLDGDQFITCDGTLSTNELGISTQGCVRFIGADTTPDDGEFVAGLLGDCNDLCALSRPAGDTEPCNGFVDADTCGEQEGVDGDSDLYRSCGVWGTDNGTPEELFVLVYTKGDLVAAVEEPVIEDAGVTIVPLIPPREIDGGVVECDQELSGAIKLAAGQVSTKSMLEVCIRAETCRQLNSPDIQVPRPLPEGTPVLGQLPAPAEGEVTPIPDYCAELADVQCGIAKLEWTDDVDATLYDQDRPGCLVSPNSGDWFPEQAISRTVWSKEQIRASRELVTHFECFRTWGTFGCGADFEPPKDWVSPFLGRIPQSAGFFDLTDIPRTVLRYDSRWWVSFTRFLPTSVIGGTMAGCWGDPQQGLNVGPVARGLSITGGDCDTNNRAVNREAVEGPGDLVGAYQARAAKVELADCSTCGDGLDNNCNGLADADDPGCALCFAGQGVGCSSGCAAAGGGGALPAGTSSGVVFASLLAVVLRRRERR